MRALIQALHLLGESKNAIAKYYTWLKTLQSDDKSSTRGEI